MSYKEDNYESQAVVEPAQATPQDLVRERVMAALQAVQIETGFDRNASISEDRYVGWPVSLSVNPHLIPGDEEFIAALADAAIASHLEALGSDEYHFPDDVLIAGREAVQNRLSSHHVKYILKACMNAFVSQYKGESNV